MSHEEVWLIVILFSTIMGVSAYMIARVIDGLRIALVRESELLRARFCDFAFEPRQQDQSRWLAETSQLRWIARTIRFHKTGIWEDTGTAA